MVDYTEDTLLNNVARAIFRKMKPVNMVERDWDSGAILGRDDEYRKQIMRAAKAACTEFLKWR